VRSVTSLLASWPCGHSEISAYCSIYCAQYLWSWLSKKLPCALSPRGSPRGHVGILKSHLAVWFTVYSICGAVFWKILPCALSPCGSRFVATTRGRGTFWNLSVLLDLLCKILLELTFENLHQLLQDYPEDEESGEVGVLKSQLASFLHGKCCKPHFENFWKFSDCPEDEESGKVDILKSLLATQLSMWTQL